MDEYRGYCLQQTQSGTLIRDSRGRVIKKCEGDTEAREQIDFLLDENTSSQDDAEDTQSTTSTAVRYTIEPRRKVYFVYRVLSGNKNTFNNYQYYNGHKFGHKFTPKFFTSKKAAESARKWFEDNLDDSYVYYTGDERI